MRRWIVRLLVLLLVVLLAGPYLIPMPAVGVEAAALADADGYFIDVDGLSTYVLERGDADSPPLLLLHGWGASTFSWREQMTPLAEASYRVIAFDRPPYGLSAKTGDTIPYTPLTLADFTARVLDKLEIQKAVLVGHSQGGAVVGYFAVKYPERVEKVVFVSGALRPTDDPPVTGGGGNRVGAQMGMPPFVSGLLNFPPLARWGQLAIRTFVQPDFGTNILRSAYHDPNFITPAIAEGYSRALRVVGWDEALLRQLQNSSFTAEPLTAAQISAIAAPVMIVWGESDTWVPPIVGERLHELLPQAVYVTYPQVGHLPHEEAAAAFNADLLAFLEDASPS